MMRMSKKKSFSFFLFYTSLAFLLFSEPENLELNFQDLICRINDEAILIVNPDDDESNDLNERGY